MAVTGTLQAMSTVAALLVLFTIGQVSCLEYPGCHNLTVQLYRWQSNGKDSDGRGCDPHVPFFGSNRECDTLFYICVDTKIPHEGVGSNAWSGSNMLHSCDYSHTARRSKEFHNTDGLFFPIGDHALGNKFPNPFTYSLVKQRWVKARVYIKMYDEDDGTGDDEIDEHVFDLNGLNLDNTGNKWAYPFSSDVIQHNMILKTTNGRYYSKTGSRLSISYKAVCCQDYYNYDCDVFCVAQQSPTFGFYTCNPKTGEKICRDGYLDPDTNPPCVSVYDPCSSFTCQNGGSHVPKPLEKACVCECPPGVTGHRCQTELKDNCPDPSPCLNGGTCGTTDTSYVCACPDGYTGDKCQFTTCATSDVSCQNGGVCIMKNGVMGCDCPVPFHGLVCDECECSGHGTCDKAAKKCNCFLGWDGDECQVDVCEWRKCLHDGKCILGKCQCPTAYTGEYCEYEIGACTSNPCQNNATCHPQKDGAFKCECNFITFGTLCENIVPQELLVKEDPNAKDPEPEKSLIKAEDGLPAWIFVIVGIGILLLIIVLLVALLWRQKRKRRQAEAQTEHAVRNGGLKNFDNPLYGDQARGAAAGTQTSANGTATAGTQVYDTPKKGLALFGGNKKKKIVDDENPYDDIGATGGNHYDVPPSKKGGGPPPLPKRATERKGQFDNPTYGADPAGAAGGKSGSRRDKPPAYLSSLPPEYSEQPPSPISVVPIDYTEPAEDNDDDPVKLKKKLAAKYSKA